MPILNSEMVGGEKMKIVRVIARLNVGGPARHVAWLAAATQKAGIESLLVAGLVPPGEDDMTYFATEQGVTPIIIPEMSREISPLDVVAVWKLFRLLLRERVHGAEDRLVAQERHGREARCEARDREADASHHVACWEAARVAEAAA